MTDGAGQPLWVANSMVFGAGVGLVVGVLLGGAPGVALGMGIGAGVGLVLGAAATALRLPSRGDVADSGVCGEPEST